MPRRTSKVFKVCKCGRSYSKREWEALDLCGTQHSPAEKRVFIMELRHCLCGSTICVTRYGVRSAATSPLPR